MLTMMLQEAKALDKFTIPEQHIYNKLAKKFEENTNYLYLDPTELENYTEIGTRDQWRVLLTMVETQNFIKGQMAFMGQIDQRKTYASLVQLALGGNQQAAKQVQELSGIMNQQDSNRTIVLHHIPRPQPKQPQTQEVTE